MQRHVRDRARRIGEDWAERKADLLMDSLPASVWPDVWPEQWNDFPGWLTALPEPERDDAREEASEAAASRWGDLLTERRSLEDLEDDELDGEASARGLAELLRPDLPARLTVHCDGPRAYLLDGETGEELTVHSLADAWRVIEQWREHPR